LNFSICGLVDHESEEFGWIYLPIDNDPLPSPTISSNMPSTSGVRLSIELFRYLDHSICCEGAGPLLRTVGSVCNILRVDERWGLHRGEVRSHLKCREGKRRTEMEGRGEGCDKMAAKLLMDTNGHISITLWAP
jgi:hypothetical protein